MSRIGKKPIELPAKVTCERTANTIKVAGPRGELAAIIPEKIDVFFEDGRVVVKRPSDSRQDRAYHGLVRTLIQNMVTGVSTGYEKNLEIVGVGYKVEAEGKNLKLTIGFSSPVTYTLPEGIDCKIEKQTTIVLSGIDKEKVGKVAADIRRIKKPEPYKGKGIKYAGEEVKRKVGKSVGA
ncbi:large subunit ribosomal protein L6 [Syntrophus gentianae]|uniref:Large ribosomal subunit protein uL6 n=1 Tax=Syntrophus gentianae TaxID=43775 RepID=A0A1H7USG9_9BACT|nr:50S ribosomal protein L6 [Syntrophus gentianae]SEL99746.1 large subunit ribosomal protein L6 [Syntrophus gentianae]